jgi:hypothetical protein
MSAPGGYRASAVSASGLEGQLTGPAPAPAAPAETGSPLRASAERRLLLVPLVVAALSLLAAFVATRSAGLPLRDPGWVTLRRLGTAVAVLAAVALADAVVRAALAGGRPSAPSARALAAAARARWTRSRLLAAASVVAGFHLTYFAYRNIKSVAPLLRPGDVLDGPLLDVDRWLFAGHDPAALLHDLLGTGASAHVLAAIYMAFFSIIPLALAAMLVLIPDVRTAVFAATALALTWILGAGSYLVLPSIGPFHADPASFADLPATPVHDLQVKLVADRLAFLAAPTAPGATQSIGAFASLHTAIMGTIAVTAHLVRAPRALRAVIWAITAGTVLATVYFGWHFVLDDVGGAAISVLAVGLAALATGVRPRAAR